MQPSLDYLRPSPVRGQLEPSDPNVPQGWRYIQTTDTPNELKVLLPPGTAAMYEQLLKIESLELSRKPSILWERIMEIRHLKDRMIRKCQRLTRSPYPKKLSRGGILTFQTIMAPADFRVKEMEKWFREQRRRTALLTTLQDPVRSASMGGRSTRPALPAPGEEFGQLRLSNKYHSLPSSSRRVLPITQSVSDSRTKPSSSQVAKFGQPVPSHDHRLVQTAKEPTVLSNHSVGIFSPPALPILLRSQRSAFEDELSQHINGGNLPPEIFKSPSDPSIPFSDKAVLGSITPATSSSEDSTQQDAAAGPGERGVRRRPSCIKRSSIGDIPKTVSWADETELQNRLATYANAAKDAQLSGRKWEEIREIYLEQMTGLDTLQEQVSQGLANLRLESEHLERVERTISQQREALRATFHDIEQKQSLFQSKVQEALQEADQVLSIVGIKRDG